MANWRKILVKATLLSLGLIAFLSGTAAWATYPGTNGRIAFVAHFSGTWQLYSIKPDGTGLKQITISQRRIFCRGFPTTPRMAPRLSFATI